jgi:hypothetical protein
MRSRFFTTCLVVVSALIGGCTTKTVTVHVRDGEYGLPIAGAQVSVSYGALSFPSFSPPKAEKEATDSNGRAVLHVKQWRQPARVTAMAPGYLFYQSESSLKTLREWRADLALEKQLLPPAEVDLNLYRAPLPTVKIIVPDGYRGPVRIHWTRQREPLRPLGNRVITYYLTPGQPIEMTLAPPLQFVQHTRYDAFYASGGQIPNAGSRVRGGRSQYQFVSDDLVAWRFVAVTYDEKEHTHDGVVYAVGTATDADPVAAHMAGNVHSDSLDPDH